MLTLIIAACDKGSGDDTPVPIQVSISNLQYTTSTNIIIPYQESFYINGTIDYTNAQSGASQLRLVTSAGVDMSMGLEGLYQSNSGTIMGVFEIAMPTQPGTYSFQVWIIDGKGNSSNKLSGSIQMNVNDAAQAWVTLSQQYTLHDVIWKNGMFIAVGENGTIVSSPNSARWTQQVSGENYDLRSLCWTGNQYIVVGDYNTIISSPQGINWNKRGVYDPTVRLYGIASNGNSIVAVGSNTDDSPQIIYSTDGINWTRAGTTIPGAELSAITWSGSKYVAVGARYGRPFIMSSPNGLDWEITYMSTSGPQGHLVDIAWSGSRFVATGAYVTAVSTDGVFWNIYPNSGTFTPGVTWSGNRFVAVALNKIYTSPDGITWTKSADVLYPLKSITWSGTQYIAVGFASPVIMSSP